MGFVSLLMVKQIDGGDQHSMIKDAASNIKLLLLFENS